MPELLLTSITYGDYISIIKLIIFLLLFFPLLWIVGWVHTDSDSIGAKSQMWTGIVLGTWIAGSLLWLVIPAFIVGLLFYVILTGSAIISYVSHRNTRVLEFDKVLTLEHIKKLFSSKEQENLDSLKTFLFVTANDNEIPMPRPKTPDFFGYRAAYDLFNDATWRRADKILFSPTHSDYNVIYYIDGVTTKRPAMSREQMEYFSFFIKNLADLDIKEKRKPQKSKFKIRKGKETFQWEVRTAGSTAGEQMQFQVVTQQKLLRLADIGLMPEQLTGLNGICDADQGFFLISGPAKSGVTTTFYALLRNNDAFLNSIDMLERETFADLPNITQNVYSLSDTGTTTYARRLQSITRMAPDIVGAADCEDAETAKVVCTAVKEGLTLYVTLRADNSVQALVKWLKWVGDKELAVENLLGICNQRLLRRLCDQCKQGYAPNKDMLRKFNLPPEKAKVLYRPGKVVYDKHGKEMMCDTCQGTGFVGRIGVFETIMINDRLRKVIIEAKTSGEISKQFRTAKMLYLQEQALRSVVSGVTAVNEMVRVFSATKKAAPKKAPPKG